MFFLKQESLRMDAYARSDKDHNVADAREQHVTSRSFISRSTEASPMLQRKGFPLMSGAQLVTPSPSAQYVAALAIPNES
jgi:hypothetical protein